MAEGTTFFALYSGLTSNGLTSASEDKEKDSKKDVSGLTNQEILRILNEMLSDIKTLEDYRYLVDIVTDIADCITPRVLYIFFQALVPVEERIWHSAGMNPPIADFMDDQIDMLLDEYTTFAVKLETSLYEWAVSHGYTEDPDKLNFILKRNEIYQDYIVFAGIIMGDITRDDPTT